MLSPAQAPLCDLPSPSIVPPTPDAANEEGSGDGTEAVEATDASEAAAIAKETLAMDEDEEGEGEGEGEGVGEEEEVDVDEGDVSMQIEIEEEEEEEEEGVGVDGAVVEEEEPAAAFATKGGLDGHETLAELDLREVVSSMLTWVLAAAQTKCNSFSHYYPAMTKLLGVLGVTLVPATLVNVILLCAPLLITLFIVNMFQVCAGTRPKDTRARPIRSAACYVSLALLFPLHPTHKHPAANFEL